jgi:hypothetical protein
MDARGVPLCAPCVYGCGHTMHAMHTTMHHHHHHHATVVSPPWGGGGGAHDRRRYGRRQCMATHLADQRGAFGLRTGVPGYHCIADLCSSLDEGVVGRKSPASSGAGGTPQPMSEPPPHTHTRPPGSPAAAPGAALPCCHGRYARAVARSSPPTNMCGHSPPPPDVPACTAAAGHEGGTGEVR